MFSCFHLFFSLLSYTISIFTVYLHIDVLRSPIPHEGSRSYRTRCEFRGNGANSDMYGTLTTSNTFLGNGIVSSFVQTRGSIPAIWNQKGKSLKPKAVVHHSLFTVLFRTCFFHSYCCCFSFLFRVYSIHFHFLTIAAICFSKPL